MEVPKGARPGVIGSEAARQGTISLGRGAFPKYPLQFFFSIEAQRGDPDISGKLTDLGGGPEVSGTVPGWASRHLGRRVAWRHLGNAPKG
jgi:hypothetical protein